MAKENGKRYGEIRQSLTQLDLHHHSLSRLGHKLVSEATKPVTGSSAALYAQSLQLSKDCFRTIHDLCENLDKEDLDSCQSVLNRLDLAIHRASQARTPTLCIVNIWRVIEAIEQFLTGIVDKYGYVRLSEEVAPQTTEEQNSEAAELARLFAEYRDSMATKPDTPEYVAPPFSHGVLRWRDKRLFYVERIEDGARWIELDPDYEREGVVDEQEAIELVRARTIEGHPITLRLDLIVDEFEVDNYVRSQMGSEYFVSGYQISGERTKNRGQRGRRR